MSTEQRDFRPFDEISSLDSFIRAWTLRIGGTEVGSGGRILLEDAQFLNDPAELRIPLDNLTDSVLLDQVGSELESVGLTLDDLGFAVNLSSPYLRISEFRHVVPFKELAQMGSRLSLTDGVRPDALRSPRAGCSVAAIVYLRTEKSPGVRRPWRFGTWISRADFSIETIRAFTGFTPLPLTPELKKELGLAAGTLRFISLEDQSPLEEGISEDSVRVYVDSSVLAKISAQPRSKGAIAFQRQLFVDAVSAILAIARTEPEFQDVTWSGVKQSLLGRVLELLVPATAEQVARDATAATYLDIAKDNPARLMTFIEEATDLLSSVEDQLEL